MNSGNYANEATWPSAPRSMMSKDAGAVTQWPQGGLTKANTPALLKAVRANELRQARIARIAKARELKLRKVYRAKQ